MVRKELISRFPFNRKQAWSSSLVLSLLMNTTLIICFIFLSFRMNPTIPIKWNQIVEYFAYHFLSNIILLFILYSFVNRLVRKPKNRRRALVEIILGTILICGLLSPVLAQIQWALYDANLTDDGFNSFVAFNLIQDMIMGVMMLFETGIRYSTYQRQQTLIINQNLVKENIRTRYEALKNQLDPHFLFNSLNTLNGLIGVDDDKAHDYVDNLSSVFRYTLRSKAICTLDEEIEFVNSYVTLLKIRYGDNLVVRYNIEEKYRNYYLMPVSLQLLVENAIKHNIISNKKPLFILIETTDKDTIIVQNLINPKLKESEGSGVGLANIANRYSILFGKSITITNKEGVFTVEIPLLGNLKGKNMIMINDETKL